MLADISSHAQSGRLDPEIHRPFEYLYELLDFITEQLPIWRDHPDRALETSETVLTDQLCSHLNSAARISNVWSRVQFRTEIRDEIKLNRTIDLTPKPCAESIIIEGRRHSQFDSLLPIECKRLPTPDSKERDLREYVSTGKGTTGGIQRFKSGYHGACHHIGAIIGYVQANTFSHWLTQINGWIDDLSTDATLDWTSADALSLLNDNVSAKVQTLKSRHSRGSKATEIELRHLWIDVI